jgi:8-oxo-dGTP pyrophosphatase MutT (NUDIX family)
MIERHAQAHFGAALVFPGGLVCTDDRSPAWLPHVIAGGLADEQRALRIAGWREVHEETGLAPVPLAAEAASYLEKVRGSGARLDLTALQPFAHWITPAFMPKRFDTHFYACRFEGDAPPVCDGREAVEALWISPAEALALGAARRRKLMLPTRANLQRLLPHRTAGEALAAAAAQPVVAVQPRREVRPDGVFLVIPPDAGYAETQEPLQD